MKEFCCFFRNESDFIECQQKTQARTHAHIKVMDWKERNLSFCLFFASFSSMPPLLCKPAAISDNKVFLSLLLVTVITRTPAPNTGFQVFEMVSHFAHFKLFYAFTANRRVANADNDAAAAIVAVSSDAFM